MKKILFLSLIAANLLAYKSDYEQIFLPTPPKTQEVKQSFASDIFFVLDEKALLLDEHKKPVGQIFEGSKVKVLEESKGFSKIEITAKVFDKNKAAFTANGEFLYLVLDKLAAKEKMNFWIKTSALTKNIEDAFEAVEVFYYDSCTSCHAAHAPKEHLMEDWDAYVSAMQMNAKITDEQKDRILRFMQAFASDGEFK